LQWAGHQLAATHTAVFFLYKQPGSFQYPQMLGDGRQGDVKGLTLTL